MDKTTLVKATLAMAMSIALCGCSILSHLVGEVEVNKTSKTSVVIVGVENGYAGPCPGALKDAKTMKSLLSNYSKDVVVLLDVMATSDNVSSAIERAVKNKFAVIYFSGHGGSLPGGGDEADGNDEFICCYDCGLMDDDIWDMVCQSTGKVMLIFDCCHSETMYRSPSFLFARALSKQSMLKSGLVPNMLCWSGCPDNAYSYGSTAGGEFTCALADYYSASCSYKSLWEKISSDKSLKKKQIVRQTKTGKFDTSDRVFK